MKLLPSLGIAVTCVYTLTASAQAFPDGAVAPSASELKGRLAGQKFTVQLKSGTSWRVEFNNAGYFFVDTSTGGKATGTWQAEEAKLCSQIQGGTTQCNEVRIHEGLVHLRRADGEVIKYVPR